MPHGIASWRPSPMPSHTLTTSIDRAGYPAPPGGIDSVSILITGNATRELTRITPLAMVDKLATSAGLIRGQPVSWAIVTVDERGAAVRLLVLWPRPDAEYQITVRIKETT